MVFLFGFLLFVLAVFLILLVLVQRGKGGGLAGALGGMGGQSAFGTKAGDLFTKITIGVAAVWILLCIFSVQVFTHATNRISLPGTTAEDSANPGDQSSPPSGTSNGPAESESGDDDSSK